MATTQRQAVTVEERGIPSLLPPTLLAEPFPPVWRSGAAPRLPTLWGAYSALPGHPLVSPTARTLQTWEEGRGPWPTLTQLLLWP